MTRLRLPTSLQSRARPQAGTVSPRPGHNPPGRTSNQVRNQHCRIRDVWSGAAAGPGAICPFAPMISAPISKPPVQAGRQQSAASSFRLSPGRVTPAWWPCRHPALPPALRPVRPAEAAIRCPVARAQIPGPASPPVCRSHALPSKDPAAFPRVPPVAALADPTVGTRVLFLFRNMKKGRLARPLPRRFLPECSRQAGVRRGATSQTNRPSMTIEPDGRSTCTPSFRRT